LLDLVCECDDFDVEMVPGSWRLLWKPLGGRILVTPISLDQSAYCNTICNTAEAAMATRTVRLDTEAEKALQEVQAATGLPISEALKRGLRSLQEQVRREAGRTPYDVYQELDLGPGGYAIARATDTRRGVLEAVRRKLRR
jgi:hypothetical protein